MTINNTYFNRQTLMKSLKIKGNHGTYYCQQGLTRYATGIYK